MPVILETISQILTNIDVGGDGLIVGYVYRLVYSIRKSTKSTCARSSKLFSPGDDITIKLITSFTTTKTVGVHNGLKSILREYFLCLSHNAL